MCAEGATQEKNLFLWLFLIVCVAATLFLRPVCWPLLLPFVPVPLSQRGAVLFYTPKKLIPNCLLLVVEVGPFYSTSSLLFFFIAVFPFSGLATPRGFSGEGVFADIS